MSDSAILSASSPCAGIGSWSRLPRDPTLIMTVLGRTDEKLDEILALSRNDEEEAEDETDA
jgi:hypothetical protein